MKAPEKSPDQLARAMNREVCSLEDVRKPQSLTTLRRWPVVVKPEVILPVEVECKVV
jgi:hypothetical protein